MSESETIAIFGSTGNTGKEVLTAALEKGYKVRVMVRNPAKLSDSIKNNSDVTIFIGDVSSKNTIKETVKGAHYVISVVGGALGKPEDFPTGAFVEFIKTLVNVMKDTPTVKVFLHQAGAFIPHPDGSHPIMMKFMRRIAEHPKVLGLAPNLKENDNIVKYIHSIQNEDKIKFKMIVTRPGGLRPESSGKTVELVGSDTNVPMGMTAFSDLGKFTVDAVKDENLYGRYPFVVAKSSGSNSGLGYIVVLVAIIIGFKMYNQN